MLKELSHKENEIKKKSENSYFKKLITQITSKQDKNIKTKQVEENQLTSSWNSLISQVKLRNNLVRLLLVLSAIGFPLIVIFMIVALNRNIKKKIDESL